MADTFQSGLPICGGRGTHSRKTPGELIALGERVGVDGAALAQTNLYMRLGRKTEAEEILWREFERLPSLDFYKPMKVALENAAGMKDRAVGILLKHVRRAPQSTSPADVLVQILIHEKSFDEAWQAAERHEAGGYVRMRLAEITQKSHPAHAWKVFARHVEATVSRGGRNNYEEACQCIARIDHLRAGLGEQEAHAAWVDDPALRHKAKRTFLELVRKRRPT